jgi:hypothetical protein
MIHAVGDPACASGALAELPANVTMTPRLRMDAALYEPAPPRPPQGQRRRGRPPKKGAGLPSLQQIAAGPATEWVEAAVRRYGKRAQVTIRKRGPWRTMDEVELASLEWID